MPHYSRDTEWPVVASVGDLTALGVKPIEVFSQAQYLLLGAFRAEGISNSNCVNAALSLATNKTEQRSCAAA